MECAKCDGGIIQGTISMPVSAPLNRKGGGLALAGIGVKQSDIKAAWDALESSDKVISCSGCGTEYEFIPGSGVRVKGDTSIAAGEEEVIGEEEVVEEEVVAPAPVKKSLAPPPVKKVLTSGAPAAVGAPMRMKLSFKKPA